MAPPGVRWLFTFVAMHYFLDPDFDPSIGLLCEEESHHAVRSLRLIEGAEVSVGTGDGRLFHCSIKQVQKKHLLLDVLSTSKAEQPSLHTTIAMAPVKSTSRLEWFLEKATELGIGTFMPLRSERTERPRINASRSERIAIAASKQSRRAFAPELLPLTDFAEALQTSAELKLIAHCEDHHKRVPLHVALHEMQAGRVIVLVGPEGDFSPSEIDAAVKAGFVEVNLGENRLRTETAGVYCAAILHAHQMKMESL